MRRDPCGRRDGCRAVFIQLGGAAGHPEAARCVDRELPPGNGQGTRRWASGVVWPKRPQSWRLIKMLPTRAARATIWLILLLTTVTTLAACAGAVDVGASPTATPVVPALPEDRGDATGEGKDGGSDEGSGSAPGKAPGGGGGGVVDPDQPVGGVPAPGDPQDPSDGALRVQPEPGIVDAIPHAWDHIDVAP